MEDSLFSVQDQVVIVSGGSRGIGRAIAAEFLRRGSNVIATARAEDSLAEMQRVTATDTNQAEVMVCDVSDSGQIEAAVSEVIKNHGRIDTLVNCAGVNRRKPALEFTEDDYDFVMDINLKGAFQFACAVGRQMVKQESGSVINILSLNTDRPLPNVLPYAASKAGLGAMTRSMATEWGQFGIRVNGLAPGFIVTDLTEKLWSDETMRKWAFENTPQQRLGRPEDMAGTAIFLASRASEFMNGQFLYVDGGFTAGFNWPIPE